MRIAREEVKELLNKSVEKRRLELRLGLMRFAFADLDEDRLRLLRELNIDLPYDRALEVTEGLMGEPAVNALMKYWASENPDDFMLKNLEISSDIEIPLLQVLAAEDLAYATLFVQEALPEDFPKRDKYLQALEIMSNPVETINRLNALDNEIERKKLLTMMGKYWPRAYERQAIDLMESGSLESEERKLLLGMLIDDIAASSPSSAVDYLPELEGEREYRKAFGETVKALAIEDKEEALSFINALKGNERYHALSAYAEGLASVEADRAWEWVSELEELEFTTGLVGYMKGASEEERMTLVEELLDSPPGDRLDRALLSAVRGDQRFPKQNAELLMIYVDNIAAERGIERYALSSETGGEWNLEKHIARTYGEVVMKLGSSRNPKESLDMLARVDFSGSKGLVTLASNFLKQWSLFDEEGAESWLRDASISQKERELIADGIAKSKLRIRR